MDVFEPIIAAIVAMAVCYILGFFIIPVLKKLKCGQEIREEGPKWHQSKSGTPTMGGIMIIGGFIVALGLSIICAAIADNSAAASLNNTYELTLFFSGIMLGLGMGAIGFIDDYIKVVKKRNLGLTAFQKTVLQMLVSAAFLFSLWFGGMAKTYIPFVGDVTIDKGIGLIFWPIALFFVYGFVNAVNLTDGVDGLASCVTVVASCGIMILSAVCGRILNDISACALAGACAGFLFWNSNPAKVFMGDTGSLFLGGMVVAVAFGTGKPILLLLFGIVYLAEALSVVLQVAHFKRTKKRLFKMTPIHHHFELSGWKENKIVLVFSLVTVVSSALALFIAI